MTPELKTLDIGDPPERWEALGFGLSPDDCGIDMNYSDQSHSRTRSSIDLGGVRLQLGADGSGIAGWGLTGIPAGTTSTDGLPTELVNDPSPAVPPKHPNRAFAIDHVVLRSPDFDRTAAALEASGMPLRRVATRRDGGRMGFRRLGAAILELVEASGAYPGPARFWGLVVVVEDLDALAERLGNRLGSIREAVQPGRRIATLRESAGLGEAMAFMSPEPPR